MQSHFTNLKSDISACQLCAERFAGTATAHEPRPTVWFDESASILIAGQAPGMRVHQSGRPFTDPSGDRLRDWLELDATEFYDRARVAIVPMAFCFPGYNAKGADLAPPAICAQSWHRRVMEGLGNIRLTILVGGYAQKWHLKSKASVTDTVRGWGDCAPSVFPLPHPSWRTTAWLKKNLWFERELLPALRQQVRKVLNG